MYDLRWVGPRAAIMGDGEKVNCLLGSAWWRWMAHSSSTSVTSVDGLDWLTD